MSKNSSMLFRLMQNAYQVFIYLFIYFCAVIYCNMSITAIPKQFACFVLVVQISCRGDAQGAGVEEGWSTD